MHMKENSPHQKGLLRVMILGTALSFGILGAIIASMKDFLGGNAAFEFSLGTVVGFAAGCTAGLLFWRLVLRRGPKAK
jgi:hypothetical protein